MDENSELEMDNAVWTPTEAGTQAEGKEENVTLTFRKALRRGATVKMPRMPVSMGITGLSKNLLQMHVREECLH
jgi:hypothetical protein